MGQTFVCDLYGAKAKKRRKTFMKKTVVFDFDGVIHSYKSGWKGATVIPDPPVPGIAEAIQDIRNAGYDVVIVSTRCATDAGMEAVKSWLHSNLIEVDAVMKEKPPAIVYIDDRAICFDGNPDTLLYKIQNFKVWTQEPKNKGWSDGHCSGPYNGSYNPSLPTFPASSQQDHISYLFDRKP